MNCSAEATEGERRGSKGTSKNPKRVSRSSLQQNFCHAARSAIAGRAAARKTRICNQLLLNYFSETMKLCQLWELVLNWRFRCRSLMNLQHYPAKYVELICNLWNHTDHVLFSVCEHLRLYKFQTETKRGEAESRNSTNKSKWKRSGKLARSTPAWKHEAQRSSLYHIDEEHHLKSARPPRAPRNTWGTVYPVHIHSTGN